MTSEGGAGHPLLQGLYGFVLCIGLKGVEWVEENKGWPRVDSFLGAKRISGF